MADGAEFLRDMREMVRGNLGLKALALGIAIALWWFVAGESKVEVGFVVPLEIRNVPEGLTVTNKVERQVEVRVAGPPSLLGGMQQSDLSASIDLAGAKSGRQVVNVDNRQVKVPPGLTVQRIYPNAVEVNLERLERKRVPLVARIAWEAEERRRISRIEIVPSAIEVEALPDELARMKSVPVPVAVPDTVSATYAENVRVEMREAHAKIVGNPVVRVTVYFRK